MNIPRGTGIDLKSCKTPHLQISKVLVPGENNETLKESWIWICQQRMTMAWWSHCFTLWNTETGSMICFFSDDHATSIGSVSFHPFAHFLACFLFPSRSVHLLAKSLWSLLIWINKTGGSLIIGQWSGHGQMEFWVNWWIFQMQNASDQLMGQN